MTKKRTAISLKFGDTERELLGKLSSMTLGSYYSYGLTEKQLVEIHQKFPEQSTLTSFRKIPDHPDASILVLHGGVDLLVGEGHYQKLLQEMESQEPDKKHRSKGVISKRRQYHALSFSNFSQPTDYENQSCRVINFEEVPNLLALRRQLQDLIGELPYLTCDALYYFDLDNKHVGYRTGGCRYRKIEIGVRLGEPMKIKFHWCYNFRPDGTDPMVIEVNPGDIYFLSEKAVGTEHFHKTKNKKEIYTLIHSAGTDLFLETEDHRMKLWYKVSERYRNGERPKANPKVQILDNTIIEESIYVPQYSNFSCPDLSDQLVPIRELPEPPN